MGISTAQRFLREYPSHPQADYVLYMQGRINFERSIGLVESSLRWKWLDIDGAERDTQYARGAFTAFANLRPSLPEQPIRGRCPPAHAVPERPRGPP